MCYLVCGMVHIKESLLLIRKSSAFTNDSGLPLSLSEWSFTICPTPNLLSASLNKTFPSFLPSCYTIWLLWKGMLTFLLCLLIQDRTLVFRDFCKTSEGVLICTVSLFLVVLNYQNMSKTSILFKHLL